ncbi:peroxidase 1-like [Phragmites australis]|uniref:peroxidase 1-like n=1 Tax=Phragmites australis TaxID=29695 RepID=UPI002D7997DB|nr:peroxidase 1-like [Phragmites australis]
MTGHVDWYLAASEEAGDLERKLRETVGDHLFKARVTSAYLALVYVRDHIPDLDLTSVVAASFGRIQRSTEELGALTDSFLYAACSFLWTVQFDPLRVIEALRVSNVSEALRFLPLPSFNLIELIASFIAKGLDVDDLVVLSGAHTVGVSHYFPFVLDNHLNSSTSDMNPALDDSLRRQCLPSPNVTNDPTVVQDVVTLITLDNQYYKNIQQRQTHTMNPN